MSLFEKIIFGLSYGTVDFVNLRVPILISPSPAMLQEETEHGIRLIPISAFHLPTLGENSVVLEPTRVNELTHNTSFSDPSWEKGSNVVIRYRIEPDASGAPQSRDKIVWFSGKGDNQLIKRRITLPPGRQFTFSGIAKNLSDLSGRSTFGPADEIRFSGDIEESGSIGLSQLNEQPNKRVFFKTSLKTGGNIPKSLPPSLSDTKVSNVTSNSFTIASRSTVAVDDFKGGRVNFGGDKTYEILSNTQAAQGSPVQIVVTPATLISDGVVANTVPFFQGPDDVEVTLEIYCESVASLVFDYLQIEEGLFHTSPIYQSREKIVRQQTTLTYLPSDNPTEDMDSFGVFISLSHWEGDGNIIESANWKLWIESQKIKAKFNESIIEDEDILPDVASIYIQVSTEAGRIDLYVNEVFKASTPVSGFSGERGFLVFSSEGVRAIKNFYIFSGTLLKGAAEPGDAAQSEVLEAFSDFISSEVISLRDPVMTFPRSRLAGGSSTNPGRTFFRFFWNPEDIQDIQEVNVANKTVKVASVLGFDPKARVIIQTKEKQNVMEATVEEIQSQSLLLKLSEIEGVKVGHQIGQPKSGEEMLVSEHNYEVVFLEPNPTIRLSAKAPNGFVVENLGAETDINPIVKVSSL